MTSSTLTFGDVRKWHIADEGSRRPTAYRHSGGELDSPSICPAADAGKLPRFWIADPIVDGRARYTSPEEAMFFRFKRFAAADPICDSMGLENVIVGENR